MHQKHKTIDGNDKNEYMYLNVDICLLFPQSILKLEELDLPFRRNQEMVMNYFTQYRNLIADFEEKNMTER